MPDGCSVLLCSNLRKRDNVQLFRIPTVRTLLRNAELIDLSIRRRDAWLQALGRDNTKNTKYLRVCSKHFISGKY